MGSVAAKEWMFCGFFIWIRGKSSVSPLSRPWRVLSHAASEGTNRSWTGFLKRVCMALSGGAPVAP